MAAPSKNFTSIADSAVDADSPLDTTLLTQIRDSLIHLEEWLGDGYTAAKDHDHDDVNSKAVVTLAKVGSFTYDTSTASGTQAITGVGFQPSAIIFFANQSPSSEASWGMDDATDGRSVFDRNSITANAYQISASSSLELIEDATNSCYGNVNSFDSDGFTISWGKVASPTGIATINYLAFR